MTLQSSGVKFYKAIHKRQQEIVGHTLHRTNMVYTVTCLKIGTFKIK